MKDKAFFLVVVTFLMIISTIASSAAAQDYPTILKSIAHDIEMLKSEFPQLKEFDISKNLDLASLRIDYSYRTHESKRTGGWTSGVPNPDDDGVWFYIDFHDPDSTAQIHTQPVTVPICLGNKRVSFLKLESKHTKSMAGAIWKILTEHGAKQCGQ